MLGLEWVLQTKLSIGDTINEAHFSMAKASWAGGNDLREQLMQVCNSLGSVSVGLKALGIRV